MQNLIENLAQKIIAKSDEIENFFHDKFKKYPANFYNSVDLRHSGFKIAPVDNNCFSAGFNNLNENSKKIAKKEIDNFLKENFPNAKNILLIPENHTRNLLYLENVLSFQNLLGSGVVTGSLIEDLEDNLIIELEEGKKIILNPINRIGDKISTKNGFIPDLIILNNDLTDGLPKILQNLSIPIIPSPKMGWHLRSKANHFEIYNNLAKEIAQIINIDPWLISSFSRVCMDVNFKTQQGIECLSKHVDELIFEIGKKYQEYGIDEKPYCFIKADKGTYGIAVWPVFSGKEVLEINKKERNKMNMLKGSIQNTQVMVQEGIRTIDKIDNNACEPLIYLINGCVVGNLFRINEGRNEEISLNSAGMVFKDIEDLSSSQLQIGLNKDNMVKIYELVARISALAAGIENINQSL